MTLYPPLWLPDPTSYAARTDRTLLASLWPEPRTAGFNATPQGGGMILNVAPGAAAVPTVNLSGPVLCTSDAVEQIEVPQSGPAGQNRYDILVVEPVGDDIGRPGPDETRLRIVSGQPSITPDPPVLEAGQLGLWEIYVPGNTVTINPVNQTFTARLLVAGPVVNGAILTGFNGQWLVSDGLIATVIVVTANGNGARHG